MLGILGGFWPDLGLFWRFLARFGPVFGQIWAYFRPDLGLFQRLWAWGLGLDLGLVFQGSETEFWAHCVDLGLVFGPRWGV